MVVGYGNDWAVPRKAERPQQKMLEGFDLPSEIKDGIIDRSITLEQLSWEPTQCAAEGEAALFDLCPDCGVLASTVAVQLTYYAQEPHTLHMWCLRGHAWRWNEIEGHIRQDGKWQR